MVCNGSHTHPLKSTLRWYSQYPHCTPRSRWGKSKCIVQAQTTMSCTFSNVFARSTTEVTVSVSISSHVLIIHVNFKQGFPSCSFHFSMISHSDIPPPSTLRFPFLLHWSKQPFSPMNQGRQQYNWSFTGDVLKKGRVGLTWRVVVLFNLRQEHTIFSQVYLLKSNDTSGWKSSASTPVPRFERKRTL